MTLTVKNKRSASQTGISAFISPPGPMFSSAEAAKTRYSPSKKQLINIKSTSGSYMLYEFYWSNAYFFNISLNVIYFGDLVRTRRKKCRRQRRVLNAIIDNVFKLTTTPVPGLRKAKDYFYEA
ncbi:hypothetical protein [Leclercia adecarboxylata]|uniref:hypothetical protein n=1 Tax=Leclercia adecarboxylata TaxID=83655 RepID=UPI00384BE1EC